MSTLRHPMASRGGGTGGSKEVANRSALDRPRQQQQRGVNRQTASRNPHAGSRKGSESLNHVSDAIDGFSGPRDVGLGRTTCDRDVNEILMTCVPPDWDRPQLLSFHLPPRVRAPPPSNARRSRRGGSYLPFNKERECLDSKAHAAINALIGHHLPIGYVNAQYRFLVKPTGDYGAHFADSDIRLQWSDILQVLIPTMSAITEASASARAASSQNHDSFEWLLEQSEPRSQEASTCPICLSAPTAPRMTKCGHVFCYACILHYLTVPDSTSGLFTGGTGETPGASSHQHVNAASFSTPSRNWKRCPICWDSIYARDLKAVRWWDPQASVDDGHHLVSVKDPDFPPSSSSTKDSISLRLVERPHVTMLALPQSSTWPPSSSDSSSGLQGDNPIIPPHSAPWHFQPDVLPYARFMLATPSLVVTHLRADLAALRSERENAVAFRSSALAGSQADVEELGLQFIDLAIAKVQEQILKAQDELDTPSVNGTITRAKKALAEHEEQRRARETQSQAYRLASARRSQQQRHPAMPVDEAGGCTVAAEGPKSSGFLAFKEDFSDAAATSESRLDSASSDKTKSAPTPRVRRNVNPPSPSASSYLFYQAASGHPIYLHPLDIKIMQSEYKSYSSFPRQIDVRVQSAQEGSMDEELRTRCKYLAHLPMGADVVFIEVDWIGMVEKAEAEEAERIVAREDEHVKEAVMAATSPSALHRPIVSRSALAPYEHALRQRRNRRRDRDRRDDRARQKAEDEGSIASPALAIQNGGRARLGSASTNEHSGGWEGSSSFGSSVQSEGSSSVGVQDPHAHEDGSPTFSQSALWGAERVFPIHPGRAAANEDFPAVMRDPLGEDASQPAAGRNSSTYSSSLPRAAAATAVSGTVKTVWGTRAPRAAPSLGVVGQEDGDDGLDDAWMELEEDYILGRRSGAVREGRGLNRQSSSLAMESSPISSQNVPGAAPDEGSKPGGKKVKKKKLILTGGGGGRGR